MKACWILGMEKNQSKNFILPLRSYNWFLPFTLNSISTSEVSYFSKSKYLRFLMLCKGQMMKPNQIFFYGERIERGFFIFLGKNSRWTLVISWSDPGLSSSFIYLFLSHCKGSSSLEKIGTLLWYQGFGSSSWCIPMTMTTFFQHITLLYEQH